MRLSVMVFGLVCVCALVIGTAAPLVQDDEDVRGAFLTSRPKDKPVSSGRPEKTETARRWWFCRQQRRLGEEWFGQYWGLRQYRQN